MSEADATLAASSPDLLNAARLSLRNVECMIERFPFDGDRSEEAALNTWANILRAAIAKAVGEP